MNGPLRDKAVSSGFRWAEGRIKGVREDEGVPCDDVCVYVDRQLPIGEDAHAMPFRSFSGPLVSGEYARSR